jgi:hypothetical protein
MHEDLLGRTKLRGWWDDIGTQTEVQAGPAYLMVAPLAHSFGPTLYRLATPARPL